MLAELAQAHLDHRPGQHEGSFGLFRCQELSRGKQALAGLVLEIGPVLARGMLEHSIASPVAAPVVR